MNFGLTDKEYDFLKETVCAPLKKQGAKIWIFGSRARGDHQTFSDVDLMIDSEKDLSEVVGKAVENLQKSNFPYKVDLVQIGDFATPYLPSFEKDKLPFC